MATLANQMRGLNVPTYDEISDAARLTRNARWLPRSKGAIDDSDGLALRTLAVDMDVGSKHARGEAESLSPPECSLEVGG